jgi:hypothetical protein
MNAVHLHVAVAIVKTIRAAIVNVRVAVRVLVATIANVGTILKTLVFHRHCILYLLLIFFQRVE